MKFIAINGSPRKKWNTAQLAQAAADGAASCGADAEVINLYDYTFKGCVSCFACKVKDCRHPGECAVKDDLSPVLTKLADADAFVIASPMYFSDVTASTRALLERLMFPFLVYDKNYSSLFKGVKKTGFIYDMNVKEEFMSDMGYNYIFDTNKRYLSRIFGHHEYITVNDTLQFSDYSKYEVTSFDPGLKAKRHEDVFQHDLERAKELGKMLIS